MTKADEVRAYKDTFARIRDAALTPAATTAHLDTLTETWNDATDNQTRPLREGATARICVIWYVIESPF